MMIRKFVTVAAMSAIAIGLTPAMPSSAVAQTLDEKDEAYEYCYDLYISRGFSDGVAHDQCYARVYGNEGGGGGSSPTGPQPPEQKCYGSIDPDHCNPAA